MLKHIARLVAALVFGSLMDSAAATLPVWDLAEVYSNADGSVQFVVHWTPARDQQYLGGHDLVAFGPGPHGTFSPLHTFTFPVDLPGNSAGRSFLIATQGFADLGVLSPDYVVPNGFFSVAGGAIGVAGHGYQYPALPVDGLKAYWAEIGYVGDAIATNFAGGRYVFPASAIAPAPPLAPLIPPPSLLPQPPAATAQNVIIGAGFTGSWFNPAQNGHGFAIQVLPGSPMRLLASWLALAPQEGQAWVVGLGPIDGSRAILRGFQTAGAGGRFPPNFDAANVHQEDWGTLTFTFSDCNHGHVDWASSVPGYGSGGMDLTRLTLPAGLTCSP